MRKGMAGMLIVLWSCMLVTGCAKKGMVGGEETIAPPTTAPADQTSKAQQPVKEQPVKEQPISETPVASADLGSKQAAPDQQAQAEFALERVFFDFDSYILSQTARDILTKNAQWLQNNTNAKIQIEGHCDERGSDEYNLALGEKRAQSAQKYMVTLGVSADRLSIISYGKEKPLDPGHDEAAWAKNRRAEFIVVR
ncbi:peptidoglycan-associated lipoprotein Pal [Geobacter sp. DSM 9736]|uniref:peptidoglycan-associated lipoprotein Pal n=1 Tax=Geobacter sp. DSM 9736 TaxID=1277350 RepID=UPI000B509E22|nr:peptidoglycan-associated lipoprotein Pal [Geobacter sp. DSM 9736]SNB47197.1 peptidoglycan-associated lipoprotein [Geobacter sp. DSM 9736]